MEVACASETSVYNQRTACHYAREDMTYHLKVLWNKILENVLQSGKCLICISVMILAETSMPLVHELAECTCPGSNSSKSHPHKIFVFFYVSATQTTLRFPYRCSISSFFPKILTFWPKDRIYHLFVYYIHSPLLSCFIRSKYSLLQFISGYINFFPYQIFWD
jgi:hypothetical protein